MFNKISLQCLELSLFSQVKVSSIIHVHLLRWSLSTFCRILFAFSDGPDTRSAADHSQYAVFMAGIFEIRPSSVLCVLQLLEYELFQAGYPGSGIRIT